jgi:hypothetical protein
MPKLQMTAEEHQEFRILMKRRQDEEKIRYKHIKERWAEQERYKQALRYREEMNIGPDEETEWEGNHGLKTIESRMNYIHILSKKILISETEKLPILRKAVDDFIEKHTVVETVPAAEGVVEDEEEPSEPNVCCPGSQEKDGSSSSSESEDEEDNSTEKPVVYEPVVYEPVVDEKWEESVRLYNSYWNAMVKDPAKEWDYVGICEWTGAWDEAGWPQNLNWGHESKYGNKRFGKRFWKEMDECRRRKKKRHSGAERRPRGSGRRVVY